MRSATEIWLIIRFECGHEIEWAGPISHGAMLAQVCPDCGEWRLVTDLEEVA